MTLSNYFVAHMCEKRHNLYIFYRILYRGYWLYKGCRKKMFEIEQFLFSWGHDELYPKNEKNKYKRSSLEPTIPSSAVSGHLQVRQVDTKNTCGLVTSCWGLLTD
jgi:hypothetical protein